MRNKLIAEFIGTYFLYLIIGMCVTPPGTAALTPLAVGVGLAAMVYSCGHISKAHFNPATTVAYFCAGTHSAKAFLPFVAVIIAGAVVEQRSDAEIVATPLREVAGLVAILAVLVDE